MSLLRSDSKVVSGDKFARSAISRHKRSNKVIRSAVVIDVRGGGRGGGASSGGGAASSGGGDDCGGDDDDDRFSYASFIAWNFAFAVWSLRFLSGW